MSAFTGLEAFKDTKRLIIIAAHPDDLETICGGTIAMLAQQGTQIFSVNCTSGDIGTQNPHTNRLTLANTRQTETEKAADILNIVESHSLAHRDGELVANLELRAQIARLYRKTQADTLFTFDPFWAGQIHPDHRAAGQAALDAYMPSKMPLYRPEQFSEPEVSSLGQLKRVFLFSTTRNPDIYIDITGVYPTKLKACMAHKSQFPEGEASLDWMEDIDTKNGEIIEATYAETFKSVDIW